MCCRLWGCCRSPAIRVGAGTNFGWPATGRWPSGRAVELPIEVLLIAFHQPISRDLIGTGPHEPRRGAPYAFVTTETFLAAFGMESLRDLPDPEQLDDAGLAAH